MINGRTRLHVVANGTMTGQRYIDEVLLLHGRLFRGADGGKFVFMDDNATCHRTLAVQDCLDSEGIQRLVWPARSPDLNPIENVIFLELASRVGRRFQSTDEVESFESKGRAKSGFQKCFDGRSRMLLEGAISKEDSIFEVKNSVRELLDPTTHFKTRFQNSNNCISKNLTWEQLVLAIT
ncbi:transposable element Tc1 transposase [Trichonephila clavipes]|uniref:Transposable element Tc1 transposase n=1 Tax=Trichonephila clavipes TaxID=2585209 RepID=A0A8X6VZM1_TRICX|nr:transposable element Tc1 transposase [Trichonephila clavipes]